jgi:pimeloyl-ACP methyl ester carboxylesterase
VQDLVQNCLRHLTEELRICKDSPHGPPWRPRGRTRLASALTDLFTKYSIPVIFYDQIGNGRSTHLPERKGDESFWLESLFIRELDNLIDHLGLRAGAFDIFGQSWGAMFGSSYAASRSKGLRRLVLANGPASIELWSQSTQKLRAELANDIQEIIDEADRPDQTESPE